MGRRACEIGLVVGLCLSSGWVQAQERLLDPPVPFSQPTRPVAPQTIQPVSNDVPVEPSRPAVRLGGVRTASGESGTVATRDYDRPSTTSTTTSSTKRDTEADDLFLKSKSRSTSLSDFDPPARKDRDRKSNRFADLFGGDGLLFKGDDCFSNMISPVTNPYLFEDPRSLTEIRPTFYYQKIPTGQPEFQGGNIWYFGTSARIAFNERWSVTLNKLGAVDIDPGSADNKFGFGEVHIGPKWSFYRNTETETIAAAGLIFQLPFGNKTVYQDTGTLSLVPYLTVAQQLADTQAGAVNGILAGGYSFSVNRNRSDYFYVSGNLNFDWANRHRFYPLIEMNWFTYTSNGQERPTAGFEARDVANLGGTAKGSNLLTTAFGARYKINERAQIGAAYEIPFIGNRDLFRYRFTIDVILRF